MSTSLLAQVGALGVGAVWGWLVGMLILRPGGEARKWLLGGGGSLLVGALTGWIARPGAVVWFAAGALTAVAAYWLWRRYLRWKVNR